MKRRSTRANSKPTQARTHKVVKSKRGASRKARRNFSSIGQATRVEQLTRELNEALERQAATADLLRLISSPSTDVEPVFDAIVRRFALLCGSMLGAIFTFDGELVHYAGGSGFSPKQQREMKSKYPVRVDDPSVLSSRAILAKAPVHIDDVLTDPHYDRAHAAVASWRRMLAVPMLRGGEPIGAIVAAWAEPGATPKQHENLLQVFADHAVIAIENTRVLNELRQRTTDLSESLERQTATAEVLKVISRSTFELQTVLDTLTVSAVRLCQADKGAIFLRDGDLYRIAAIAGFSPQARQYAVEHPIAAGRGTLVGRVALTGRVNQIPDVLADAEYEGAGFQKAFGFRTNLGVPLLRDGATIGVFSMTSDEVRPFTDKQIELVATFADQAVIAIENARLLDELRQRTADLGESLERQTATSEVLGVISRSKFELQPILQSVVDTAARLCRAEQAVIYRLEGDGAYRFATGYSLNEEYQDIERQTDILPGPGTAVGRAALHRQIVRIDDAWTDPLYEKKEDAKIGGVRSMIGVPLMRDREPIGVIALARCRVEPFSDREIELVATFADQAVIAIQNVRLFEAEQERTRELAKSLEDLRTAQDRLVQTQKLASLGQLTAGIAHEIKNPLNFVNNFSGLSLELIGELDAALGRVSADEGTRAEIAELAETLRGNLDKIAQHGRRADSIVKNMLLHSREGSGERRRVNVNALVEESLNLAYHGARAEKQGFTIALERFFDPQTGDADVFPQEITRVLLNLIANGFHAAAKRQSETGAPYEPTLTAATRSLGDRVEIVIRDNGIGIAPEVKEKMFNPFFTTKPAGEGTGLGLSISHDIIVKQHSGAIEVDTELGAFTEFKIILPRTS